MIECIECGHMFDPDESTCPETCQQCVEFTEWYLSLTPAERKAVAS